MANQDDFQLLLRREDAVHASGDVGVMSLGVRTDTPATISSATGDYEPYKVNGVGAVWASITPATAGGLSIYRLITAATTNASLVKSSAGNVYSIYAFNAGTVARYLKFSNTATAPTPGSTAVAYTVYLPASSNIIIPITTGLSFSTGISFCVTTGVGDTDATVVSAASEVVINIGYK